MDVLVLLLALRAGRVIPVGSAPANTGCINHQSAKKDLCYYFSCASQIVVRRKLPAGGQKRRPGQAGHPAAGHSGGGGECSRGHEDGMEEQEQELPIEIFLPVRLT
jgi:hypothetical protein